MTSPGASRKLTARRVLGGAVAYLVVVVVIASCVVSCKKLFAKRAQPVAAPAASHYQPPPGYKDTLAYRQRDAALNACVGLNSTVSGSVDCMHQLGY
jgi:hypothetical protein